MADLRLSTLTLAYVHVPVRDVLEGTDLSAVPVEMALVAAGASPGSGDWKAAAWTTDGGTTPPTYRARLLVGPAGAVTLAAGTYAVWVRITDSPEVPVIRAPGQVVIF